MLVLFCLHSAAPTLTPTTPSLWIGLQLRAEAIFPILNRCRGQLNRHPKRCTNRLRESRAALLHRTSPRPPGSQPAPCYAHQRGRGSFQRPTQQRSRTERQSRPRDGSSEHTRALNCYERRWKFGPAAHLRVFCTGSRPALPAVGLRARRLGRAFRVDYARLRLADPTVRGAVSGSDSTLPGSEGDPPDAPCRGAVCSRASNAA